MVMLMGNITKAVDVFAHVMVRLFVDVKVAHYLKEITHYGRPQSGERLTHYTNHLVRVLQTIDDNKLTKRIGLT